MIVSGPARDDSRKPYDKRSAYERRAAKRRARVRRMREEGETVEAIARALGVSRPTVHRDLAALRDQDTEPKRNELGHLNRSLNPAEPGNLRAAKHGARSERIVAPLAERKLPEVAALCAGMPAAAPAFAKAREVLANAPGCRRLPRRSPRLARC